jgi:hypothetical protein
VLLVLPAPADQLMRSRGRKIRVNSCDADSPDESRGLIRELSEEVHGAESSVGIGSRGGGGRLLAC